MSQNIQQGQKRCSEGAMDSADSPLKKRLKESYWKKPMPPSVQTASPAIERIDIKDLKPGSWVGKSVNFRVTLLGTVRNGRFLKFHGMDSTGELSFVVFDQAEKVFQMLKVNHVYQLINFDVRPEDTKYPQYTSSNVQIKLRPDSALHNVDVEIPAIPFKFQDIKEILDESMPIDSRVDVFGVITAEWGLEQTSGNKVKRDVRITDMEKNEIILTLWEELAEQFNGMVGTPIALRKAVVRQYNGAKLLTTSGYSLIWTNPELGEQGSMIREWFIQETEKMKMDVE